VSFDYLEYVQESLDGVREGAGDNVSAACPFCGKANHFSINIENGHWRCFKCDERGLDFAWLIAEVEGLSLERARAFIMRRTVTFRRREVAPESLSDRLRRLRGAPESTQVPEDVLTPLPTEFVPVHGPDGRWSMPEYLLERGMTRNAARHWGLGYCTRGRYADRIVMPIVCPAGSSFTARAALDGMRGARYLNPEEAKHGRLVYGWAGCDGSEWVVLVEGPFDTIRLWQYGTPALALLGKELHRDQLRLLCQLPAVTRIVVMLDPEARGMAEKVASRLSTRFEDIWIAQLPGGADPGDSSGKQVRAALSRAERYTGDRAQALKVAIGLF